MKKNHICSPVLLALALVLALFTAVLSFAARDQDPILVSQPSQAKAAAEHLMEAIQQGDFAAISDNLLGSPSLGEQREPESAAGRILWAEFLDSFSYELGEACHASESGVAMDVTVSYLDFTGVFDSLGDRTRKLLNRRVGQAEHMEEVYDENNQYREDVIQEVLSQAVREAVEAESRLIRRQLTLNLSYDGGRWRVVPDAEVLSVISAGTIG